MTPNLQATLPAVLSIAANLASNGRVLDRQTVKIETIVSQTIQRVSGRYGIPGMAVGVVVNGKGYVFSFGRASLATKQPVTERTLFEIGSVTKTFTATLVSYAQECGCLSLSDKASKFFPSLRESSFDFVSLLNLGTHTAGGLPLQVPGDIASEAQLMEYFRKWKPDYAPGTSRTYSNPSIGLLGLVAAKSMNQEFSAAMEEKLFDKLGLKRTYLNLPTSQLRYYAQGYTTKGEPIRMAPGVIGSEAYGIRTTAADLLRFVEANKHGFTLDERLQRAIDGTHTGYYRIGAMTQDLVWEQYPYPVRLNDLIAGNSSKVIFESNPVLALDPPSQPKNDVVINKTGSTNGFGAYVAFVPGHKLGIVLLANRSYPIEARVTAAYEILTRLSKSR